MGAGQEWGGPGAARHCPLRALVWNPAGLRGPVFPGSASAPHPSVPALVGMTRVLGENPHSWAPGSLHLCLGLN